MVEDKRPLLFEQRERAFFDPTPDRKYPHLDERPTEADIRMKLAHNNGACPLNEIIVSEKNRGNLRIIKRALFTAMKRYNHSMRGMNMGIYAASGQGKTFIARQIVKTIELPLVFLQASAVDDTYSIFQSMKDECQKYGTPMVPQRSEAEYLCPCMVVIIDEAHALKPKLMKSGLLNAMEADDGWMACSPPGVKGDTIMVDCRNVCWIACTTERGVLFDAFDNRLTTHINWHPAGEDQITQIVTQKMKKYAKHGDVAFPMPEDAARLVAQYRRVPREAISFARKVIQEKDMSECGWDEAVEAIANDMSINEWGMTDKQVKVLTALGKRPIAKSNLVTIAGCRIEELERYVLPELFDHSNGGPFAASSSRGVMATRTGLRRLDEMGIPHKGDTVTIEHAEEKRK